MKTLVAGPWIGEFGWELMCWQAHLRRISKDYEKTIVYSRKGHDVLYNDFAEFRTFDPVAWNVNGWRNEGSAPFTKPEGEYDYIDGQFNIGFDYRGEIFNDGSDFFKQDFFPIGVTLGMGNFYDILLHIRAKDKERDWDFGQWKELAKQLIADGLRLACIGHPEFSKCIDGVDDKRGLPLIDLANLMANSGLVVGPSSGVMHFAALALIPHISWGHTFNKARNEVLWNPLGAWVKYIDEYGWNPSAQIIHKEIHGYLKEWG